MTLPSTYIFSQDNQEIAWWVHLSLRRRLPCISLCAKFLQWRQFARWMFWGPILVAVSCSPFKIDDFIHLVDLAPHLPRSKISAQSDTWGSRNKGRPSKAPSDGACHTSINHICGDARKSFVVMSIPFKFYVGLLVLIPIRWLAPWWWHIRDQWLLQPCHWNIWINGNRGMGFWNPGLVGSVGLRIHLSFPSHFAILQGSFHWKEKDKTHRWVRIFWLSLIIFATGSTQSKQEKWYINCSIYISLRLTNCRMLSQKSASVPWWMNIPFQFLMGPSLTERIFMLLLFPHSWG